MPILETMRGYKTYIVCTAAILTAFGAYLTGDLSGAQAIEAVWIAVAGVTLRNAIK